MSQLETNCIATKAVQYLQEVYIGYFFPYITIGCRKSAELYSGNF